MPTQYSFVTKWKFNAPVEVVWDIISSSTNWPNWWKGVLKVDEIDKGNDDGINGIREYIWKSILPYKLKFSMKLIERVEYKKLSGIAFGELEGNGTWVFEHHNGVTWVICFWNVITNKPWMNYLSFILKPLFQYNHNVLMKWGYDGLAKQLESYNLKTF